jgi:hypothetical protein
VVMEDKIQYTSSMKELNMCSLRCSFHQEQVF